MELAVVVYLVGFIERVSTFLGLSLMLMGFAALITLGALVVNHGTYNAEERTPRIKSRGYWPKTFFASAILLVILPSQDTIKYMGAAYLVQSVYESKEVREIGSLASDAVKNQLKVWATDNEEINTLLETVLPEGE